MLGLLAGAAAATAAGADGRGSGDSKAPAADLRLPLRALWHIGAGQATLSTWRAPMAGGLVIVPAAGAVEARTAASGEPVWRVELSMSPRCAAIAGDLLMVGGVAPGGDDLVALDLASGARRFGLRLGGVFAAPIADGPWLVAASSHALAALKRDGAGATLVWRVDFPRGADGLPGGPALARPALLGDRVVVGAADGRLHAFALADGRRLWSVDLPRRLYSGAATDGEAVVAVATRRLILAFDAEGRERWRHDLAGDPAFAAPVIEDGVLYAATGTGGAVLALDAQTGAPLWETTLGAHVFSQPALARHHFLVGDMRNRVVAIGRARGEIAGAWSLGAGGGVYLADPAISEAGLVAVGSAEGTFHMLGPDTAPEQVDIAFAGAPNPFRDEITFPGAPGPGRALVFDVAGRLRRVIAIEAGEAWSWDGRGASGQKLAPGVYFLRLETGQAARTGKIALAR